VPPVGRLRELLGAVLPDYMVPSAFVGLSEFPLTANGKLDRRGLPAPDYAVGTDLYRAPETDTEEALTHIWADVLGVPRVGVDDSFFDLGGDSLRSVQLTSRVLATFDIALTPRDVLLARTVSALAEQIEEKILLELEQLAVEVGSGADCEESR
jgi:acyl carrier protein